MGRFLRVGGGQGVNDVFLIAQATGTLESFEFFERVFGEYRQEMKEIFDHGLQVENTLVRVHIIHNHDFKVLYLLTGGKGARSNFPCPFC